MVSALDSGSSGLGSSPGRGHCVVFLGPRSKWVPVNCQGNLTEDAGGLSAIDKHPMQGSSDTSSRFMLWKSEYS